VSLLLNRQLPRLLLSRKSEDPLVKRWLPLLSVSLLCCLALTGCSRFKPKPKAEYVYVLAKETFLRDRVAAVSNRVAMVQNGERLELLERGRRFLQVKTDKGEVGWIEEHAVVNPDVITGFEQLQKGHEHDPVVATAALRDDAYLHLKPGRDTDRYYLLPEGDKLQLLLRASVPKAVGPQASGTASSYAGKAPSASEKKSAAKAKAAKEKATSEKAKEQKPAVSFTPAPPPPPPPATADSQSAPAEPETAPEPPPPPAMEDWWLVRDGQGKVGWMVSRRMDVDVPDEIAGYAEGQRIVAAYLLRKVDDPGSNFPDKQAPEYVTVLNPYQDGLPYDFSQVRVFTWSLKKHRYETAFRQRNLQGYLPVVVANGTSNKGDPQPTFQFKQGIGDSVTIDPDSGATRPTSTEILTYRLEGTIVKKVGPASSAVQKASPQATGEAPSGKNQKKSSRSKHHPRK